MQLKKIVNALFPAAALAATLMLGGCASPVTSTAMVPANVQVTKQHQASVSVSTGGGAETNPMWKSQISDADLKQALVDSIKQSKAFSSVVEGKGGKYNLNVSIFNLTQPSMGLSFTVSVEMGWTLTNAETNAVVWRESIKSEHTAGATDAFAGTTRLRMATEGAARNNVSMGLAKLSALSL